MRYLLRTWLGWLHAKNTKCYCQQNSAFHSWGTLLGPHTQNCKVVWMRIVCFKRVVNSGRQQIIGMSTKPSFRKHNVQTLGTDVSSKVQQHENDEECAKKFSCSINVPLQTLHHIHQFRRHNQYDEYKMTCSEWFHWNRMSSAPIDWDRSLGNGMHQNSQCNTTHKVWLMIIGNSLICTQPIAI